MNVLTKICCLMYDIAHIFVGLKVTPEQQKAYDFYKKNSLSIEIVKDDVLQKVNFRVKNKVCIYQLSTFVENCVSHINLSFVFYI